MFVHIGGDTMVRVRDIIGIFNIEAEEHPNTARFIELAKRNDAVQVVEIGDIKSFVVTEKTVYYSPISSLTLKKRAYIPDPGLQREPVD